MIQMPTAISDGSWITLAATGASIDSNPSATAAAVDGAARATTNVSSEASKSSGSSCPERWAMTTGTSTASDSASRGRPGR
jgi:hypothetical protein